METGYCHTQVGTVTLVILGVAAGILAGIAIASGAAVFPLVFRPLLGLCAVLFGWLTVEVVGGSLECRFGPGLIRKSFALSDIREARVVRNPWYYGWGIHWTLRGWVLNVSGLRAVEITLASGRRYRIGSDEPAELAEAIRCAAGLDRSL